MKRIYDEILFEKLKTKRFVLIKGPRSSQKSTHIYELINEFSNCKTLNCEDKKTKKILEACDIEELLLLFDNNKYILLKEAQSLKNIQQLTELILLERKFDNNLVFTCSYDPLFASDFYQIILQENAMLTLFPPFFQEIANEIGIVKFDQELEKHLIYGNYEQVIHSENAESSLKTIIEDTIFTQLNPNDRINKEDKLRKVLQFLSLKLGEALSYNEIGYFAGLDNETVERYIDLLERTFILIRIPSFYNENKYELKKTHTFFFWDNGIRNALINNYNPTEMRIDIEALWTNWLIAERMKWNAFLGKEVKYSFWRTHTKQHVELIEQSNGEIFAYKSLYDKRKKPKFPKSFIEYYPQANTLALNRSTYWAFLSKKK